MVARGPVSTDTALPITDQQMVISMTHIFKQTSLLLPGMATQRNAIIEVAKRSRVQTGFGRLDRDGQLTPGSAVELWITGRMTHVFALATLMGIKDARELAEHGISCLAKFQRDPDYGGYYAAIEPVPNAAGNGIPITDTAGNPVGAKKESYAHAFVILAAASGVCAHIPGADELLKDALDTTERIWWEPQFNRVCESFDRGFSECEPYRGVNANMHTTECFLAAYDATNDRLWLDRAIKILEWIINNQARSHSWFIPEHFDAEWNELPDYNRDQPAHPFRPWGYTIGHSFEWARLCLHARAALEELDETPQEWMLDGPIAIIKAATQHGWDVDGAPGFVYTVGLDLKPIVRERMHWVPCEALGAVCVALKTLTAIGAAEAAANNSNGRGTQTEFIAQLQGEYKTWWDYCVNYFVATDGLWWHELTPTNEPGNRTWPDKPDAYHVTQALLLPELGTTPCFARALAEQTNGTGKPPSTANPTNSL